MGCSEGGFDDPEYEQMQSLYTNIGRTDAVPNSTQLHSTSPLQVAKREDAPKDCEPRSVTPTEQSFNGRNIRHSQFRSSR